MCWRAFRKELCPQCRTVTNTQGFWKCEERFGCRVLPVLPESPPIFSAGPCERCRMTQQVMEAALERLLRLLVLGCIAMRSGQANRGDG